MYLIRRVEEEIVRALPHGQDQEPGPPLDRAGGGLGRRVRCTCGPSDVVFGTYRGHALYLAKGGDLPRMIAELYGKVDRLRARQGRLDAPDRPSRPA